MRAHVVGLLQRHEIEFTWCRRPTKAWGAQEIWEVSSADQVGNSYATALHEIGHILGRHQGSRMTMVRERWAWGWAQENALAWTERMEKDRLDSLDWHATHSPRIHPPTTVEVV
jgi:hypothetical protein